MLKQIQLKEKTLKKIAHYLFLAFTDQQIAHIIGISERTYFRLKASPEWQKIKIAEYAREAYHRERIWKGEPGWQGAAWMLERKYASQLAKPEVQLSLNTGNTTNNTIVITAEQASGLRSRCSAIESELAQLTPPNQRTSQVSDKLVTNIEEELRLAKAHSPDTRILSDPPAHAAAAPRPPARTPGRFSSESTPALSGNFQSGKVSSNSGDLSVTEISDLSSNSKHTRAAPESPRVVRHVREARRKVSRGARG